MGIERYLRDELGLMRNIVLGRNSPTSNITAVEMIVCKISTIASLLEMVFSIQGSSRAAAPIPYTTSIMLLPTNMVEMKNSVSEKKRLIIRLVKPPFCISSYTLTRLAEMKAISVPEKSPENIREIKAIMSQVVSSILLFVSN